MTRLRDLSDLENNDLTCIQCFLSKSAQGERQIGMTTHQLQEKEAAKKTWVGKGSERLAADGVRVIQRLTPLLGQEGQQRGSCDQGSGTVGLPEQIRLWGKRK